MSTQLSRYTGKVRTKTPSLVWGFTFVEILIVVGILITISAVGILWLNPARQLALARNNKRLTHMNIIVDAVYANAVRNNGVFTCAAGLLPSAATRMASSSGNYNIAPCVVPLHLATFPYDPTAAGASYASTANYDSAYTIARNAVTGAITVAAPLAELGSAISVTR